MVFVDLPHQREQILAGVADADCGHSSLTSLVQEPCTSLCHLNQG
jgi:hypothetical protein